MWVVKHVLVVHRRLSDVVREDWMRSVMDVGLPARSRNSVLFHDLKGVNSATKLDPVDIARIAAYSELVLT